MRASRYAVLVVLAFLLAACSQQGPQEPRADFDVGFYTYSDQPAAIVLHDIQNHLGRGASISFHADCEAGAFDPSTVWFESQHYYIPASGAVSIWLPWRAGTLTGGPVACEIGARDDLQTYSVAIVATSGVVTPLPPLPPAQPGEPLPGVPLKPIAR